MLKLIFLGDKEFGEMVVMLYWQGDNFFLWLNKKNIYVCVNK